MATYKGINGFAVQSVASDPSPSDEGQVWYNNATYAFKLAAIQAAAFSAGGNMNTPRRGPYATGTQTASLAAGGFQPPFTFLSATELYNGTSWTSNPTGLATARSSLGTAGSQTLSLGFGGNNGTTSSAATEEWTGTSVQVRTITTS